MFADRAKAETHNSTRRRRRQVSHFGSSTRTPVYRDNAFKRIALRCGKTSRNYASFAALALGFNLIKSVLVA